MMDDYESVSLTKGCFVHKPDKVKKKKSGSLSSVPTKRHDGNRLWNEIDTKIKQIQERSYVETFDSIVKFIQNCFEFPLQAMEEVPAAVLVMGVNMSDHSNIFNLLEKHLHLNEIYSTVVLDSRRCSDFAKMQQTILFEIVKKYEELLTFEDEVSKKPECCFQKLYGYFNDTLQKAASHTKKMDKAKRLKLQATSKAMVFLIQDVESFKPELLQKLVLLCKIYSGKLPIVLIFGMASAMVTLNSILPQKALCCLEVETFHSASATEYLTNIIEEVIISPELPFKFGARLFRLIVDTVLYHDFSISNLMYLLKFSMLEHLHGRNFTCICCYESEIEETIHKLSTKDLQMFKSLPSLKVYLDNNPRFAACMNDTTAFKESIISFLQKIFYNQKVTFILLKLLHCFVKDLPGYPLGKQLRELYSLSLEKEIYLTDSFIRAQKLLKIQSQQSLKLKLEMGLELVNNCHSDASVIRNVKKDLEDSIEKISNLTAGDFDTATQEPLLLQSDKITSRFQLQEKIQMSIKQKRSTFDAVRNDIVDSLLQICKNICPPSHSPLYEVFYFDDISSVKKHLMAVPRVTSCYSLSNPHHYLKCKCCKINSSDETQPTMPDICSLYKLHLESGKLINLYDWLEAFKAIKQANENGGKKHRTKTKSNDNDLNIRFLLAVSELQMLGFIKPTKRKTDHVARVTFGSF